MRVRGCKRTSTFVVCFSATKSDLSATRSKGIVGKGKPVLVLHLSEIVWELLFFNRLVTNGNHLIDSNHGLGLIVRLLVE